MPSPLLMLEAMAAAGSAAALVLLLCAWPWRSHPGQTEAPRLGPLPPRGGGIGWGASSVGSVLGVGAGIVVGCWLLGIRPHWPPREDQDRLLLVLLPAVLIVELRGAISGGSSRLVWLLRMVVALGAARLLLHNTIYLADLAGPDTRKWAPAQSWMILGGLAAALMAEWILLTSLVRRAPGQSVPLALALACAGAGITVMLSGYASGGQIGLALAGALAGVALASLALSGLPGMGPVVGIGIIGLFALLLIGRFFGELTTGHAIMLFAAPLLCWVPELPYICRLRPVVRGIARVVLTAAPVAIALILAQRNFVAASARPSSGDKEPTLEDYMNYGK